MEAATLLGSSTPTTVAEARVAAEQIVALGARNVLVTGGHLTEGASS